MKNLCLLLFALCFLVTGLKKADAADSSPESWQCRAQCEMLQSFAYGYRWAATSISYSATKATPLDALDDIKEQCKADKNNQGWVIVDAVIKFEKRFRPAPQSFVYDAITTLATPGNACQKISSR